MVSIIVVYLVISFIVGFFKYSELISFNNYYNSIPEGDLEFYEFNTPRLVTLVTLIFLPAIPIAFILDILLD